MMGSVETVTSRDGTPIVYERGTEEDASQKHRIVERSQL
jgi:hypothetical protein